jgi:hypothetical protein
LETRQAATALLQVELSREMASPRLQLILSREKYATAESSPLDEGGTSEKGVRRTVWTSAFSWKATS